MVTIRPYDKKDFRFVQDICMQTSWMKDDITPISRAYMCAMYCDYYLDNQSQFCFVAEDDGNVIGYILCSADCDDYMEKMQQLYLPLVRKLSSKDYMRFSTLQKIEQRYIHAGYTAHLHIDILPEYQCQGIGTKLIQQLTAKLKETCVEGLYLVCSAKNQLARAFYEKRGFEDIDYITGCVVYGKKFFTEDDE